MIKWNLNIWKYNFKRRQVYMFTDKKDFGEEEIYDNMPSSTILNKARTNTLQLNDRNRHTNKKCFLMVCDTDDKVDI